MDNAFVIPGTNIRFGLDPVLGLVPGIGDTLSMAVSGYIYSFARSAGVPGNQRMRMLWNIFIDWLIGLVPVLGDLFDVRFKANTRNIRIILDHAENQPDIESPHSELEHKVTDQAMYDPKTGDPDPAEREL